MTSDKAIQFIRLSKYFTILPLPGVKEWDSGDKVNGAHQAIGICAGCGQRVHIFQVAGNKGIGLLDHTVVRCTGDGCKARIVLPGKIKTLGELARAGQVKIRGSSMVKRLLSSLKKQADNETEAAHFNF